MKHENHKWIVEDGVMVALSAPGPISDEVWKEFVKDLGTKPITRYLGVNIGAVQVSSTQRKAASDVVRRRGIQLAVVTDEKLVRGMVTAVSWLGVDVKAFSWAELREAIEHLGIRQPQAEKIMDVVAKLKVDYMGKGKP